GDGGRGTFGSHATAGGRSGGAPAAALEGASGGWGGRAGVSGHGAGGPSVAVAYTGEEPVLVQSSTVVGEGGAGVPKMTAEDGRGLIRTLAATPAGASIAVHRF